ncbi:hypothetical protein F4818DRAFT_190940 [Hypoxylon cercidicola]|nr:hypothetical protein F4818DRAFT_190940 [Hypoxylon cercidicola]
MTKSMLFRGGREYLIKTPTIAIKGYSTRMLDGWLFLSYYLHTTDICARMWLGLLDDMHRWRGRDSQKGRSRIHLDTLGSHSQPINLHALDEDEMCFFFRPRLRLYLKKIAVPTEWASLPEEPYRSETAHFRDASSGSSSRTYRSPIRRRLIGESSIVRDIERCLKAAMTRRRRTIRSVLGQYMRSYTPSGASLTRCAGPGSRGVAIYQKRAPCDAVLTSTSGTCPLGFYLTCRKRSSLCPMV